MTIDKEKLKALARAVAELEDIPERQDEHAEAVDHLDTHMHCHTILALLAEIENLDGCDKAYREVWEKARGLQSEMDDVMSERDKLKAENEALRKDAERYRWLKVERRPQADLDSAFNTYGIPVDDAIDAAMAKEAK